MHPAVIYGLGYFLTLMFWAAANYTFPKNDIFPVSWDSQPEWGILLALGWPLYLIWYVFLILLLPAKGIGNMVEAHKARKAEKARLKTVPIPNFPG